MKKKEAERKREGETKGGKENEKNGSNENFTLNVKKKLKEKRTL